MGAVRRGYFGLTNADTSQIFTVLSLLPLTIRSPSGLKLTLLTKSVCPLRVRIPVRGQNRINDSPVRFLITRPLGNRTCKQRHDNNEQSRLTH